MPRQEPLGIDTSEALSIAKAFACSAPTEAVAIRRRTPAISCTSDAIARRRRRCWSRSQPGPESSTNAIFANRGRRVLAAINRSLPSSKTFPVLVDRGRLKDGRLFLMTYLFEEFALAMSINAERLPMRLYDNLRIGLAVATALTEVAQPADLPRRSESDEHPLSVRARQSDHPDGRLRVGIRSGAHTPDAFYDPPTTANLLST